jgi:hypothetical protein
MRAEQPDSFRPVFRSPDIRSRLRMYFVMGSTDCAGDPEQTLAAAISGGITAFQFREKGAGALSGEAAYQLAARLKKHCEAAGVLFIVPIWRSGWMRTAFMSGRRMNRLLR